MFTRFKNVCASSLKPLIVSMSTIQDIDVDGTVSKRLVDSSVNICTEEYCRTNLPSYEEYSYENLLASGQPLREVDCRLLTSREQLMHQAAYLTPDTLDKLTEVIAQARENSNVSSNTSATVSEGTDNFDNSVNN